MIGLGKIENTSRAVYGSVNETNMAILHGYPSQHVKAKEETGFMVAVG